MTGNDSFTPQDTPDCPFCHSSRTLQVRPESALCFNQQCPHDRFVLQSERAGDSNAG